MQKHLYNLSFNKAFLGLSFFCLFVSCSNNANNQSDSYDSRINKKITLVNGDKVQYGSVFDTAVVFNKTKNKIDTIISSYGSRPITLNGRRLLSKHSLFVINDNRTLATYIENEVTNKFPVSDSFEDKILDVIVDTNGHVLSYEYFPAILKGQAATKRANDFFATRSDAYQKALNNVKLQPATLNGEKVSCITYNLLK